MFHSDKKERTFNAYVFPQTRNSLMFEYEPYGQYSQFLVFKSGTANLSHGLGTKSAFRQREIKENHNI